MVITSPLHTVVDFHNHVLCRVKKRVGRPLFCIFECVLLDILVGDLREMHRNWPVATCYFFGSACAGLYCDNH